MNLQPITILGGGLAGLSLGIGLRQEGIPVSLCEKGHYPRHRVCGEFISGRGQAVLGQLGLRDLLESAGAVSASHAMFVLGKRTSTELIIEPPALCLSRFRLDALLAQRFQDLGGKLLEQTPVRGKCLAPGTVCATGRAVRPLEEGCRWFGLKIHARDVALAADLEMHCFQYGYIGLTRIEHGKVNVCGLFRRYGSKPAPAESRTLLLGPPGSALRQRLDRAQFEEDSFCAVAGLSLKPQRAEDRHECSLGDALTMIPPVTGNGMSMALEAAAVAVSPLVLYSRGALAWDEACARIARTCDDLFARRLTWAHWLQRLLFLPWMQTPLGILVLNSRCLWTRMFTNTR